MKFLTAETELRKSKSHFEWETLHNQLFEDNDGTIYLVPRYFQTDGYTIPLIVTPFIGDRMEYDIRPAVQHDWECKYRFALTTTLTEFELRQKRILHKINKQIEGKTVTIDVCEDIPAKYLKIIPTTFVKTIKRFQRCLDCIDDMNGYNKKMIGNAVFLNIGWLKDKPCKFNILNLYTGT